MVLLSIFHLGMSTKVRISGEGQKEKAMSKKYYAHSLEGRPSSEWQPLEEHLKNVAELAGGFAEDFGFRDWGYTAGLWHDLGKYQPEFQDRLLGAQISVEHSGIGASQAYEKGKSHGLPLSFVIGGHHAGLANLVGSSRDQPSPIMERVKSNQKILKKLLPILPDELNTAPFPRLPPFLSPKVTPNKKDNAINSRRCEFWIRFLFSTLVDADRLDTECLTGDERNRLLKNYASIEELQRRLNRFLENKAARLSPETLSMPVNKVRASVLAACLQAAQKDSGVFSLTVPTGGGKTLSSMAFALSHAEIHHQRRIIVVIPYTSIIEQNAAEYRLALGTENLIEHHSNLDTEKYKQRHGEEETRRMELASENWDAPVIVTTTVQFFESLFSNRPSRCRKLHNIARSVIILDEVQTLPPEYLICILDALNELANNYGCSVVLSTATPPALSARERFEWGLKDVREIVPSPDAIASELKRVEYSWPDPDGPPVLWENLAKELTGFEQVLAVVHRRKDAYELAEYLSLLLGDQSVFHLSALMCPAHRSDVLDVVKNRLSNGKPCRLVSTQLIEAGVDVDFPVVYRALGGLDSMVQAAGRCNREGRLEFGRVKIFRAPSKPPSGTARKAMDIAEGLLRKNGNSLDISAKNVFFEYFRSLYFKSELDAKRIQSLRQEFKFADVAGEFRLIEDGFTESIVVPYKEGHARLKKLLERGPSRATMRSLQPFIVNIYPKTFERLQSNGALEEVADGLFALNPVFTHLYTHTYGLAVEGEIDPEPGDLVV